MIIESLEKEISSLGDTIEKYRTNESFKFQVESLMKLRVRVEKALSELKDGTDLQLLCKHCGFLESACNFDFVTEVQNCDTCKNHIRIKVICPNCTKERTVYRETQFED